MQGRETAPLQPCEKATEALVKEFEAEEKKLTDSKLKIDDKIKRVEQLQEEKAAFVVDGKLPTSIRMKIAVTDFKAKVATARTRCARAFDAVAERYGKTDLAAAKTVLAAKAEFLKDAPLEGKPLKTQILNLLTSSAWVHSNRWRCRFTKDGQLFIDESKRGGKFHIDDKGFVSFTWNKGEFPGEGLQYNKSTNSFTHNKGGDFVQVKSK